MAPVISRPMVSGSTVELCITYTSSPVASSRHAQQAQREVRCLLGAAYAAPASGWGGSGAYSARGVACCIMLSDRHAALPYMLRVFRLRAPCAWQHVHGLCNGDAAVQRRHGRAAPERVAHSAAAGRAVRRRALEGHLVPDADYACAHRQRDGDAGAGGRGLDPVADGAAASAARADGARRRLRTEHGVPRVRVLPALCDGPDVLFSRRRGRGSVRVRAPVRVQAPAAAGWCQLLPVPRVQCERVCDARADRDAGRGLGLDGAGRRCRRRVVVHDVRDARRRVSAHAARSAVAACAAVRVGGACVRLGRARGAVWRDLGQLCQAAPAGADLHYSGGRDGALCLLRADAGLPVVRGLLGGQG
eukprot:2239287-Rhodomonas_salina.3